MGKRRSQLRQNAPFKAVAGQPQQPQSLEPVRSLSPARAFTPGPGPARALQGGAAASGEALARARDGMSEQVDWLTDNPFALVLGGVALGVLISLVLPVTEEETERLGSVGENIAGQVQHHVQAIGDDMVEHGKAVIVETVQASVLGGKSPVDAVQQSVQEHLATVAANAQTRVEESLGRSQSEP